MTAWDSRWQRHLQRMSVLGQGWRLIEVKCKGWVTSCRAFGVEGEGYRDELGSRVKGGSSCEGTLVKADCIRSEAFGRQHHEPIRSV